MSNTSMVTSAPSSRAATAARELLVPVDLSHESWNVLPLARMIAQRLSIPLAPLFVDVSTAGSPAVLDPPVMLRASVAGEPVSVEVVPGLEVVPAIDKRAVDHPGSVVTMFTHGLSGTSERVWGNVCDELLRTRDASVLAVGPRFDQQRNADVRRVAVCIDAADPYQAIVRDALGWAEALNVPMVVVTVQGRGRSRPGEDETYHVMAAVFEELPPARVSVTAEALDGADVAAAIVGYADRRPGTLLALAPGAGDRALHALTHPVTMHVVRESRAPLILRWHRPEPR